MTRQQKIADARYQIEKANRAARELINAANEHYIYTIATATDDEIKETLP